MHAAGCAIYKHKTRKFVCVIDFAGGLDSKFKIKVV